MDTSPRRDPNAPGVGLSDHIAAVIVVGVIAAGLGRLLAALAEVAVR